jgi:hypothetical protein
MQGARGTLVTLTRYADERLLLLKRLRTEAVGGPVADLFRPSAAELRCTLGTSLADLRIPFRVDEALRAAAHSAAIDAFLLAGQRHKATLPPSEFERITRIEGFPSAALRPASFSTPAAVQREGLRRAFADAMEAHHGVDAGLVASSFGTDRPGRVLLRALHAVLANSVEDEAVAALCERPEHERGEQRRGLARVGSLCLLARTREHHVEGA